MSKRHMRTMRRAGAVTALSAALALTLTACGGDGEGDGGKDEGKQPVAASPAQGGGEGAPKGVGAGAEATSPTSGDPIANIKGDGGLELLIHSAKRDDGGFLTVDGQFKNTGSEGFSVPVSWNGLEQAVAATGQSFAGMTLVDSKGKKRYYVLRDTENRPLTTYGYNGYIQPGKTLTFFAQFPAPPPSTAKVDLQFPGFPSTTIEIS
ncbi:MULTISPECIES: hypothetical protein [Streptomyces]|uniref:Secreted protein n=1 Tax=Streptomyces chengmaiensis TaxID=3040919 RepID=A0ABT6HZS3_9ACTN|nr:MULTISPECIES: hypothetical protein [Streptomyces]MDH2393549.1 hypothetical protein [Streptomyces chengmaiensis]WRQ81606.1 hypothetical protein I3F59_020865 [Streptomyces sp. MUM 178J]